MTNENFFADMFQREIIDQNWTTSPATLAFIMEFYVYNPNLHMVDEKRIVIEYLEQGGFINMEHDHILMNTRLFRRTGQSV